MDKNTIMTLIEQAHADLLSQNGEQFRDYLHKRGLTDETINEFSIGSSNCPEVVIVLPYGKDADGEETAYYSTRQIEPAEGESPHRKPGKQFVGNEPLINAFDLYDDSNDKPVFIVESAIDCYSIKQCGGNAVALGGVGTSKLIEQLSRKHTKKTLIISLDNDEGGKKITKELAAKLQKMPVRFFVAGDSPATDLCPTCKDANEQLIKDEGVLQNQIQSSEQYVDVREKQYRRENGSALLALNIAGANSEPPISTGIVGLDEILEGGLRSGLYLVGAESSMGKTTFVQQMADNIAASGRDVMFISLEMSKNELVAKSVTRQHYQRCLTQKVAPVSYGDIYFKSKYDMLPEEDKIRVQESAARYSGLCGDNLFVSEGVGNIGINEVQKQLNQHIQMTGNAPVLIIDYVQILAPFDARYTDKQNMDKAIVELKRISRDYTIPVIGISSYNRAGYGKEASRANFKESGGIEYGADMLIGMQFTGCTEEDFDVTTAYQNTPRMVDLKILKNRSGQTGGTVELHYYPQYQYFKEAQDLLPAHLPF